ncbi:alpha-galactosidase [Chelatococcus reniformis]|uniref:alpha-galactosidase n=1 Tax=Chelatococcus reniformis TaxID=1494448 RepID=UPI00166D504D|nr:alpha-galactosidase [Chelatococcus reniformis]
MTLTTHDADGTLAAVLSAVGAGSSLTYGFEISPGVAAVTTRLAATGLDTPGQGDGADVLEALALTPFHLRLTRVDFHDGTDARNELVQEAEWLLHPSEQELRLAGCLFAVEDVLTGGGLLLLKQAPLPYARPVPTPVDLVVRANERRVMLKGHGNTVDDDQPGYGWTVILSSDGRAGRTAALQAHQRAVRPYRIGRDGLLLSNTWGDRNRDGRINAAFLSAEITAAHRLGVEVVQIDDGWQKGTTSNSVRADVTGGVWEGFHGADQDFWAVHPERFPHGLAPLVQQAKALGVRLGLWFAPDSADDFAHWHKDAERLLQLHADHGIDHFKVDSVKLRSKRGERNLHAFFDHVLRRSDGRILLDCDVTAETRPGYFGRLDAGPLFIENRYTDTRRYWPHATLRSLWQLAHYLDPLRLRMEWLNNARHVDKYTDDPLAPASYRPDCVFATVMFASPLAWFEVSGLPESYFAEAAPLIATWKAYRDAVFAGSILPIGAAPDGVSWTGFAAIAPDRRSGYLLLFRELSPAAEATMPVPLLQASACEILGGQGDLKVGDGHVRATIRAPRGFVFGRVWLDEDL